MTLESGLAAAAVLGHVALWIALVNRLNSLGLPRPALKVLVAAVHLAMAAVAAGMGWSAWALGGPGGLATLPTWPVTAWLFCCAAVAAVGLPQWLWRRATFRPPAALRSNHTTCVDVRARLGRDLAGNLEGRMLARLPLNESQRVDVHEKVLHLPRLDAALDGLSIVHLSDLHLSGKIDRAYFQEVIRLANELDADLAAVTGDLVEHAACLDWVADTLGRLRTRHGAYYVLGNHDRRVDTDRLHRALAAAGLLHAGSWRRLTLRARGMWLAGNERPWYPLPADFSDQPPTDQPGELRILLSHSPDQYDWARRRDFDLMLAGHTHGGQVRLPWIGPIVSPSRHGTRYASGTFHEPPTVLHVSRGLSALYPYRWNCPPELTRLVLTSR